MSYCLPAKFANEFLKALREGKIVPEDLIKMDSAQRRAFFEPIVGKENAQQVNILFEKKLLLKDQQAGLVQWAKSLSGIQESKRKDLIDRIDGMQNVLGRADLADLAAHSLGVGVTPDEGKVIMELTQEAKAARAKPTTNMSGVNDDFLKASDDLKHYISSLMPTTPLRSIGKNLMVIGRNHLLMNPATPLKTSISQVENHTIDLVTRRLAGWSGGGLVGDLAAEANRQAWATFRATGMNTASMESLDDAGRLGEGSRFDVQSGADSGPPAVQAAEKAVRAYAKLTNKVAIDWAHVQTFTKFYQKAFFDAANVIASKMAQADGSAAGLSRARAGDIFRDAARIVPKTREGALARLWAQQQAARVTSINETPLSRLAMGIKDKLNEIVPGAGDLLMPIAKIPANVIWNGIENAGAGIPLGIRDILKGREKMRSGDEQQAYEGTAQFAKGVQTLIRTFGAIGIAAFLSSLLVKRDFRKDEYGNSFVDIGGVWINLEYVSAISPALGGMMMAKKDAKPRDGIAETAGHYVSGALQPLKHAPGIDALEELVQKATSSHASSTFGRYAQSIFTSRGLPAFVTNLTRQPFRPIEHLFFGAHGVESEQDVREDNRLAVQHRRSNAQH